MMSTGIASSARKSVSPSDAKYPFRCDGVLNAGGMLPRADELDLANDRRLRRNGSLAFRAVPERRRNDDRAASADLHSGHSLAPAANDVRAERERHGRRLQLGDA